ncbi:binding-protein-dependent transport systems inner membrane component [Beutenbergia cavernae DSM 12333]|uniref:Binding-protein-dependent transport systems inner membrane component n=1 Tax=Beutenbergia cavernae (strain ATCC BAA-8 / DSM 12333 / CCUG 43141 / JCM 11478 / NBRC 16432 / NCIMB 13614 / HKI 0122) TaxID=471853 RepID=C5C364_BEUC1|nr:carbohydrate ABC transporter permease [Beutenbergia cavernae]ACQ79763.1 binding-protein-dependent transport systems inner membrane component [Beutenbergia cavernae DSM 12333]
MSAAIPLLKEGQDDPALDGPPPPRRRGAMTDSRLRRVLLYAALVVAGLTFLVPVYWLFSSAVKENSDIYQYPPQWLPWPPVIENFGDAWAAAPFNHFLVNSLIVTVVGASIKLVNASLTAYAFVYLRFPAKNLVFLLMLGSLMVPGNVTLIVNYITMANLGWINTYLGLILPSAGSVFGMFLLRQYMLTLPSDITEAAAVDGAGHMRKLFQIVLPMCKPMLVTVGVIAVVDMWNDFIWPLIVTNTVEMRTLPIGLLYLRSAEGYNDWGAIMAGTVIVALPMLVLFLFTQRHIARGLTAGAVKG